FDERNFCLVGRRYHKRYALGDKVRIRVERANLEQRLLDFSLVGEETGHPVAAPVPAAPARKGGKRQTGKKKHTSKRH
ncbi:MAG: hypothetical protein MR446_06685, partial [Bacteroidales bacterium]|nr:hypothetical protein [Bacteroidales bacterium]